MKTTTPLVLSLAILLAIAGCDQQPAPKPAQASATTTSTAKPPADHDHDHDHGDHDHDHQDDDHAHHDHGNVVVGGSVHIAGLVATVQLKGALQPGAEAFIDVSLPADKPAPKALRAWLGSEDAAQTGKVLLDVEAERSGHGHIEVPQPLDPSHRLWLEIEDDQGKRRGSMALAATPDSPAGALAKPAE